MKKTVIFFISAVLLVSPFINADIFAAEMRLDLNVTLNKMIKSLENNDYDNFLEEGDAGFKAGLTKQMFNGVSGLIGQRFKEGYDLHYLGELNQQGCFVHLWKVVFKDNKDDVLIRLVVKNARVSGFWIQ